MEQTVDMKKRNELVRRLMAVITKLNALEKLDAFLKTDPYATNPFDKKALALVKEKLHSIRVYETAKLKELTNAYVSVSGKSMPAHLPRVVDLDFYNYWKDEIEKCL